MMRWMLIAGLALAPSLALAGWQDDLSAATAALPADTVSAFAAVKPQPTRKGTLRFFDAAFQDDGAPPWLLERVLDDTVDLPLRQAYAHALTRRLQEGPASTPWHVAWAVLSATHPEPSVRHTLLAGLAKAPAGVMAQGIGSALTSEDRATRELAARTAGLHAEGGRVEAPLRVALSDDDATVRAAAARSLGVVGAREASTDVAERCHDDVGEVRLHALRALGRLDASKAQRVAAGLVDDPDERVRREVTRALSR